MNILPLELLLFLHGMLSFIFFSLIPTKMMSSKLIAVVANKAKRPIDKTTLVLFLQKRGSVEICFNRIIINRFLGLKIQVE